MPKKKRSKKKKDSTQGVCIVVVGDGIVGKSALIQRFVKGTFTDSYKMTFGVNLKVKRNITINDTTVTAFIFELSPQNRYEKIRKMYYRTTFRQFNLRGGIIVFDLTRIRTFHDLAYWIEELSKNEIEILIIVGNKSDLKAGRVIRPQSIEKASTIFKIPYVETSAKEGSGVEEAFSLILKEILEKKQQ